MRPPAPAARRDEGTTLAELSVVMMIFGMVLVLVGTLYISSLRTTTETRARVDETVDARIGVSAMGRALRAAVLPSQLGDTATTENAAFIEATPRSIRFYTALDRPGSCTTGGVTTTGLSAPLRVTYSVNPSGDLVETKQAPAPWTCGDVRYTYCTPGPTCTTSSTVIARQVQPGALFTYYDQLGVPLAVGVTGAVAADQLKSVDSIDIALTVKQPQSSSDGSSYALRVALPNHDAVIRNQPNGS